MDRSLLRSSRALRRVERLNHITDISKESILDEPTSSRVFRFLRPRWKKSAAVILLGAGLHLGAGPARADDPLNFTDPLVGPTSPYLTIPEKFGYTSDGLTRIQSDSGTGNGTDRPVVRTISGEFLGRNFVYEIEVLSTPGGEDIAYVGFGQGVSNPFFFNEPTNSVLFRIHKNLAGSRIDAAIDSGFSGWPFSSLQENVGTFAPGGTVFRISRLDDVLTMEVVGQSVTTYSVANDLGALDLDATNAHLFFANTSEGTTFRDMVVSSGPLANSDSDGDGVQDASDQCPGTPAGATTDAAGCSGAQTVARLCPANASWKNHGAYVSCVARAGAQAVSDGLLSEAERSAIQSAAAKSSIGK